MPIRVVLDTNILISALVFGGKPRQILQMVLDREIEGMTSLTLLTEFFEVLVKEFSFSQDKIRLLEKKLKKSFKIVYPKKRIRVLKDGPDNRVLETAVEGDCQYIITGDKELLKLKEFKNVKILTASEFIIAPAKTVLHCRTDEAGKITNSPFRIPHPPAGGLCGSSLIRVINK